LDDIIPLKEIVFDIRARDGTWCKMPYPDHPNGCPNFPKCVMSHPHILSVDLKDRFWYAVLEEFDLKKHTEEMKKKHPNWSERQCRNLLYWQNGVRSRLRKKTESYINPLSDDIILEIPEACGINMIETMSKAGIKIQTDHPDNVIKVMLIGRRES
jgi:hypothetical protein